jgi:cytochrome b561
LALILGRPASPLTIAIHWATLLLIIAMFVSAWMIGGATDSASAGRLLLLHRSTGVTVWLLTLSRLGWKLTRGRSPALPDTVGDLQRLAARANEYCLYGLLALQPITGFLQSTLHGKPFPLLWFSFPATVSRDRAWTKIFHEVHALGAWALLALVALHAGAALFHHFALRDGVLRAMLPGERTATHGGG